MQSLVLWGINPQHVKTWEHFSFRDMQNLQHIVIIVNIIYIFTCLETRRFLDR